MKPLRFWTLTLALALIAVEALYVAGATVFLRTALFDRVINGNPNSIFVKTQAAYSLFPGWVQVEQVQVRGQDSNVQWLVQVDNARLWISLPDLLLHKSFHVTHLNAKSGLFDIRARSLTPNSPNEDLQELPPIPGLGPETLLKSRALAEKQANDLQDLRDRIQHKGESGLKQVKIEDIHIPGFRQIWIGAYRFDGRVGVSGNFTLAPGHQLVIPQGRLEVQSGNLTRLDQSVLQKLSGVIDAGIGDFQIKQDHGLDIFKTVSAKITLRGGLDSLDPLSFMIKNQDWFELERTSGAFSVDASVRNGVLEAGTTANLVANPFLASFSHFSVEGAALVGFRISDAGLGIFEFGVPEYRIFSSKSQATIIAGHALTIALDSPDLEVTHLYRRVKARVRLPDARITQFDFLNRWIPRSSGIAVKKGSGNVSAEFAVSNDSHIATSPGWVIVNTDQVLLKKGEHDLVGRARVLARVTQVVHESSRLKELRITGSEVHVFGSLADGSKAWKTDIKVADGYVRPDQDPVIAAKVTLDLPDVSPFLSEFGAQSGLAKVAQNLLEAGRFKGSTDLQLGENWFDLDHLKLVSERSQILGFLRLHDKNTQAVALIHLWPLSVGVELDNDGTHMHLLGADKWYEGASQMAGSVEPTPMQ